MILKIIATILSLIVSIYIYETRSVTVFGIWMAAVLSGAIAIHLFSRGKRS